MTSGADVSAAEWLQLAALPRELSGLIEGHPPSYRRVYNMVLDARIPATLVNGRWTVRRDDLPAIAATLGLQMKVPPVHRGSRKASSALVAA